MRSKLIINTIILLFIISNINIILINADEIQPQWPDNWVLFDSDPTENGDSDDYRDVCNASYHVNDYYLYLRLECYGYPNFTAEPDSRYKWFIDIDTPHNMGQSGGNVYEAEYLLFIEDSPKPGGDGLGDIYLLADLNNDGLIQDDWPDYKTSPGPILDDNIAGYRIEDNYIDLYISQENISYPTYSYLTWATDQEDPNLDSAPNIDRSNSYWDSDLTKADLSIIKSASVDLVIAGESFVYNISVTNHGPHTANNVKIIDTLPPDVIFNSANPVPDGFNGSEYWWEFSSLAIGESLHISINVTADTDFTGEISNVADVYSDTYDPKPDNNEDSEETEICQIYYLLTNIDGNGTIIKNPEKEYYLSGETVDLTAFSDTGWSFCNWYGCKNDNNNAITILMDSDKDITAHFTQDQYTLSITINGNGSIDISPNIESYTYGDVVLLDAEPALGWKFDHWAGDLSGSDNPATISMTGYENIIAHFTQYQYKLNITINGNGSVNISPDIENYTYGNIVLLNACSDPGWKFDQWTGDLTGSDNPATIDMTGNKSITAHFIQEQYKLNITIVGSGVVDVSPNIENYTYGTIVLLDADPSSSWKFHHWDGDLTGSDNPATINMTEDKNITANFVKKKSSGGFGEPFVPAPEPNIAPVANAGGPYYGNPGEDILINASLSYDPDGTIISYEWDFGDGTTGEGVTIHHNYSFHGEYTVNLTITDNEGATDKNTTITLIIKPNSPPSMPIIMGPIDGIVDTDYNFSFVFIDEDEDKIKYTIDWGDGNTSESDFIESGQFFNVTHRWKEPGVYKVTVIGDDNETTTTEDFEITINDPEPSDIPEQNNIILILLLILALLFVLLFYLLSTEDKKQEEENEKK